MDQYTRQEVNDSPSLVVRNLPVGELSNGRAALYNLDQKGILLAISNH